MSVIANQHPTITQAEPAPVVSDIPAAQPAPAVSPAPANGTGSPSDIGAGAAAAHSSVPTPPSHGPTPSAPFQRAPAATPAQHAVPAPASIPNNHIVPQPQPKPSQFRPYIPRATPVPAPAPVPSNNYSTYPSQQVYPSSQPAAISYQRHPVQPVHQQSYQQQSSRPLIVDPPRKRSSLGLAVAMPPAHAATSPGFPSPTKDYPAAFPKFSDDLSRISLGIKQSVPEAVRQAVRDNWEKCLLGSEFHQAFVLNASMHHSTPSVQNRAVHDFGGNLVANCKSELIGHFSARDIDDVADLILAKASNAFLDKALEMRLATIDAKPLLNALARAERLGYDTQDLVEVSQGEHVIPNSHMTQLSASKANHGAAAPAPVGNGSRAAQPNELQCMKCYRTFTKRSHFDYHLSRSVCSKVPPTADGFRYACTKCGQGFTHPGGLTYHNAHLVCEGGAGAASEPQQGNLPATPVSVRTASPVNPAMIQTPSSQIAQSASTSVLPANRPGVVTSASKPSPTGDPYGHLTEEQMNLLNAELLEAEQQYAGRFLEAEAIPDPEQRRIRLDSLRNTFGTKQSMIRKKYGVRLRERRTRAEIQAERERMGRPGLKPETASSQTPAPTQQTSTTSTSAWTAANKVVPTDLTADDSTPSLKRRRVEEGSGYTSPYPQQQTGPATKVSEMAGGLGASSATVAIHDPTLPPASTPSRTYQQAGARVEIHLPRQDSPSIYSSAPTATMGGLNGTSARDDSRTPDIMDVDQASPSAQLQEQEQDREPGNIKADAEEEEDEPENDVIHIEDDSEDDDDDGDIPASLPPSIRQSLASSQLGSNH